MISNEGILIRKYQIIRIISQMIITIKLFACKDKKFLFSNKS